MNERSTTVISPAFTAALERLTSEVFYAKPRPLDSGQVLATGFRGCIVEQVLTISQFGLGPRWDCKATSKVLAPSVAGDALYR